jgi:hypothetical protein
MQTIKTKSGKTVTVRARRAGANFGVFGQIVARNGRVIAETDDVFPLGCEHIAIERAIKLAERV